MTNLFLWLAGGMLSFASDMGLSSAFQDISSRFEPAKKTLENCLINKSSENRTTGCVDAYKYITEVCMAKRDENFQKKYKAISRSYFDQACQMYEKSEAVVQNFFYLDAKSCVKGYETIREQLVSLNKNKEHFSENLQYMIEKDTCKDFRSYVNLCEYVDGSLRHVMPKFYEHLPKLDYGKKENEVCKPQLAGIDGVYTINRDLASLSSSPSENIYNQVILKNRSRLPASGSSVCGEVRMSYDNLRCAKFEKFKDGEPIYYEEKEWRELRIERNTKEQSEARKPIRWHLDSGSSEGGGSN